METKGISCKIPLDLHNRVSEEIRETDSSVSKFIEMVIWEHFEKGANKVMEKGKTLAFQVSEEFFQRIKDYLARYERVYGKKLTQKEFCIEVIREALELGEEELEAYQSEEEQLIEESREALAGDEPDEREESPTQEETSDTSGETSHSEGAEGEEASDEEHGEEPYKLYRDEDIDEESEASEAEETPEEEEASSTF